MIWKDDVDEDTHNSSRNPDYDVYCLYAEDFNARIMAVIYDHNTCYQTHYKCPQWAYVLLDDPQGEEEPFPDHITTIEERKIFVETLARLF